MKEYEKFESIYDEIDILIEKSVRASSSEFVAWKYKLDRFLINHYGRDSYEYEKFQKQKFSLSSFDNPDALFIQKCREGLEVTKILLKEYLNEFNQEEKSSKLGSENRNSIAKTEAYNNKIFIVHGHDGELQQSVARVLEKQDIKPIILSEQVNNGNSIIEKIESYCDVSAAVILFTKDDMGKLKSAESYTYRARQNVVFEAGYFIAKLGRSRVIIIKEEELEIPSDLSGVVYTARNNWQVEVLRELKSMGMDIDFNKVF